MRIVAALVNPVGPAPEAETVTLLNASPEAVDLTGWSILDRDKRRLVLGAGALAAGTASGSCSRHRSPWATAVG